MAIGLKISKGDVVINRSGSLEFLGPGDKCKRDFGKLLVTKSEYESNTTTFTRYNPTYGTELDNKILYFGLSKLTIKDVIVQKLNESINTYLRLQESRKNLNIEEIISGVKLDVYYNETDPFILNIDIRYTNVLGETQVLGEYTQTVA